MHELAVLWFNSDGMACLCKGTATTTRLLPQANSHNMSHSIMHKTSCMPYDCQVQTGPAWKLTTKATKSSGKPSPLPGTHW